MRKLKLKELDRLSVDAYRKLQKWPIEIVLDNIRSGHNVGSVFRTADAFKIHRIILCGITPKPLHQEIFKTAIGAEQSVEWVYSTNIFEDISAKKNKGWTIIGVEQTDQSILIPSDTLASTAKIVLIFGNEVDGISEELLPLLDMAIEVPQFGTKHSLNVSVCAGIILWEIVRKWT